MPWPRTWPPRSSTADSARGPDAKQAASLLERAIDEVRNLCYGLRPAELDRLGIAEAASRLCAEVGNEMGIEVKLTIEGLAGLSLTPGDGDQCLPDPPGGPLQCAPSRGCRPRPGRAVRLRGLPGAHRGRRWPRSPGHPAGTWTHGHGRESAYDRGQVPFRLRSLGRLLAPRHRTGSTQGEPMKRVFIIDDHSAIREGFKVILERSGRYSTSGDVGSAEEALAALDRRRARSRTSSSSISACRGPAASSSPPACAGVCPGRRW